MNKKIIHGLTLGAVLTLLGCSLWAQKPKTQKELDALKAWQAATDPDQRIQAIENVLTNFADTEFKIILLTDAMQTEQRKRDYAQTVFYGERLLEADPKNAFALVTLAGETARHTREYDLDKEEKLAKAEKYANRPAVGGSEEGHAIPGLRCPGTSGLAAEKVRRSHRGL